MTYRHAWLTLTLSATVLLLSTTVRADIDIEKAYRRENIQLQAEKRALNVSYSHFVATQKERRTALRNNIERMVTRLTTLRSNNDLARRQIQSAQKQLDTQDDKRSTLVSVVDQAEALLTRYGVKTGSPPATAATESKTNDVIEATLLSRLFKDATTLLRRQNSIRHESGAFYDKDGREKRGQLLRVGEVATFAHSVGVLGPLAPAGGGNLKLLPLDEDKRARLKAYLAGDVPTTVPIFIYDALDKRHKSRVGKTLWQTLKAGGVVVWPILLLALVALLIVLERAFTLQRVHSRATALPDTIGSLVTKHRWEDALNVVNKRHGAVAHVLKAVLRSRHLDRPTQHDAINEAILDQLPRLQRFLHVLAVIAAISPLLGLLGTVTGMISTFDVITEDGTGDPKLLSGGISEALVTTELGLIVAIPVLLLHALLSGRVEHIVNDMENNALKVSNQIIRQRQATGLVPNAPSLTLDLDSRNATTDDAATQEG